MTLLDVEAEVKEMRAKLIGCRLANVYHLNARTFVFKLAQTSVKHFLLIESGTRIHMTSYIREHDAIPNNFAAKLRKHIRLARLDNIEQIGTDRLIDLTFGTGQRQCHVIVELFAQGNIVLTDYEYAIIMLLRSHQYTINGTTIVGEENNVNQPSNTVLPDDDVGDEASAASIAASAVTDVTVGRVAVREIYPLHKAQRETQVVTKALIHTLIRQRNAKLMEEEAKSETTRQAEDEATDDAPTSTDVGQVVDNDGDEGEAGAIKGKKGGKRAKRIADATSAARDAKSAAKDSKKRVRTKAPPLKAFLATEIHFGPELIEHCLISAGIDPSRPADLTEADDERIDAIVNAFAEAPKIRQNITTKAMKGYIVVRREGNKTKNKGAQPTAQHNSVTTMSNSASGNTTFDTSTSSQPAPPLSTIAISAVSNTAEPVLTTNTASSFASVSDDSSVDIYSEYLPIRLAQHDQSRPGEYDATNCRFIEYDSFNAAVDEFYSKQEEQREEMRLLKERAAALNKIDRVKASHAQQLSGLANAATENERKAQLLEWNAHAVDTAIASVNMELSRGIDWTEVSAVIDAEKSKRNPIALMIAALKLNENTITVSLSPDLIHLQPNYTPAPETRPMRVDVDLSLSAYANAESYYSTKKKSGVKAAKTMEHQAAAVAAAIKKSEQALSKVDTRARIQKIRKYHWFEKFAWFISSENFLCIAGKDAQQNELIVKRHLTKHDIYVHADVHGASSVVIKNISDAPIPPSTLQQAATFCVARSSAWKEKIAVEAFWVYADQVSKTAPTGQYVSTGSFIIRGKKNIMSRMAITMAVGLFFRLDDSCVQRHVGERKVRTLETDDGVADQTVKAKTQAKSDVVDDDEADVTSSLFRSNRPFDRTIPHDSSDAESGSDVEQEQTTASNAQPTLATTAEAANEIETDNDTANANASSTAAHTHRRLTAAERRQLKKAKEKGANGADKKVIDDDNDDRTTKTSVTAKSAASETAHPIPKSKRNKLKKIEKKYGLQDEDDLLIAASVLGLQNVEKRKAEINAKEKIFRGKLNAQNDIGALQQDETPERDGHR